MRTPGKISPSKPIYNNFIHTSTSSFDTRVWIDYFNGVQTWQVDALDSILSEELVLVGDIILAEILQGFEKDSDYKKAKEALVSCQR